MCLQQKDPSSRRCKHVNLPDYVLISAHARELVEADGLHIESWRRRFQEWGYEALIGFSGRTTVGCARTGASFLYTRFALTPEDSFNLTG